ncbi:MAG: hypothetical protein E6R06_23750 [Mycobacterium sp.]|nr:MAG: hypothetical protein E6R06_23750 [Mycobacterium sp.]
MPTFTAHTADQPSPFDDLWLPDYCPQCNPAGHHADRCARQCSATEPQSVTWRGGSKLACEYACDRCGHRWTRRDLWTPENLGLVPVRSAA